MTKPFPHNYFTTLILFYNIGFTSFADKNTATTKIPKQICYKHSKTKCSHPLLLLNLYANGGGPT